jgi:hypothetical protein
MNTLENKSHTNNNSSLTNESLKKIHQRSLGYWFEDGLLEIVLGGLFLLLGVNFSIEGISDPGTLTRRLSGIIALLIMVFGSIAARPIIRTLKERITYPRTGYVTYRNPKPTRRSRTLSYSLILGIVLIVVGIITSAPEKTLSWLPMFEGVIIGGFLLFIGYRTLIYRFYVLGAISILVGTLLSVSGIGNLIGMGMLFIILGFSLLFSGGYRLYIYLRQTESSEFVNE